MSDRYFGSAEQLSLLLLTGRAFSGHWRRVRVIITIITDRQLGRQFSGTDILLSHSNSNMYNSLEKDTILEIMMTTLHFLKEYLLLSWSLW